MPAKTKLLDTLQDRDDSSFVDRALRTLQGAQPVLRAMTPQYKLQRLIEYLQQPDSLDAVSGAAAKPKRRPIDTAGLDAKTTNGTPRKR